jgi:hypothetical protein
LTSQRALVAAGLVLAAGCSRGFSDQDAEKLVRTYIQRLIEAYRASDAQIADPVVSERQGLKLTGLVGVKRDADLNMEAQLLELKFLSFTREAGAVLVETEERWHYRDLQIGTGKQVGEESTDSYRLRYRLAQEKGRWVVDAIEFVTPPQVGRKTAPMAIDPRVLHGLPAKGAEQAGAAP